MAIYRLKEYYRADPTLTAGELTGWLDVEAEDDGSAIEVAIRVCQDFEPAIFAVLFDASGKAIWPVDGAHA